MSELYSRYASEYAEVIKANIYNSLYDKPSLLALLPSEKFSSCLDLGCGPGSYIQDLKTFCQKITAIDRSEEFIKIISRQHPDVNAYVGDLNDGLARETDGSFDLVISGLTIHYVRDLEKLFLEVNRVLKRDGIFAFSTHHPNMDFADSVTKNYFAEELLTQKWNTLPGKSVEVSFYRRPISKIFNSLFNADFVIDGFSEGAPATAIKNISEAHFQKLSTKPHFIFVRARKIKVNQRTL